MSFTPDSIGGEYQHKITYDELPTAIKIGLNESGNRALINYIFFETPGHDRNYARVYNWNEDCSPIENTQPYHTVFYWKRIS